MSRSKVFQGTWVNMQHEYCFYGLDLMLFLVLLGPLHFFTNFFLVGGEIQVFSWNCPGYSTKVT